VTKRSFSCTCPDFRTAELGTCNHIETKLIETHVADDIPF
jgi:hypothetical protein